jgi:hypothetical protein
MKETLRHQEAFNYYYSLGSDRSLSKLRGKLKSLKSPYDVPSLKSLQRWSKEFNWQQRIKERDAKISQQLNKVAEKEEFLTRADYRKLIKETIDVYKQKLKDKKIVVSNARDLETLAKLDLLMIGEATDIVKFEEVDKNLEQLTPEELRKLADSNR